MSDAQAEVYVLRELRKISREADAEMHELRIRTIDGQLEAARERMRSIFDLLVLMNRHDLVPVRRSNSRVWHRVDRLACKHVSKTEPNWSSQETLAFRDEITSLAGEPCKSCFSATGENSGLGWVYNWRAFSGNQTKDSEYFQTLPN